MNSTDNFPLYEEVCADIGDKVVNAMAKSVVNARTDLAIYREALPHFVSDHSERGLANWIHDRMWKHLVDEVSDNPVVNIADNGVLREICVGLNYRFRAKRHDEESNTQSYPTLSVIEFHIQQPTLDGLSELRLDYGYRWVADERRIGEPVMSLRNGRTLVWDHVIDTEALGTEIPMTRPDTQGPKPSVAIDIKGAKDLKGFEATGQ